MPRHKGSGNAIELSPEELQTLEYDARSVGFRRLGRQIRVSGNYISMIFKGTANPSAEMVASMKQGVIDIKAGKVGGLDAETNRKNVVNKSAVVA